MRQPSLLIKGLISHLNSLETTRNKMERLVDSNMLVRRDVEKVYEALYLRAFTHFESFIENLFLGMLTERISTSPHQVVPRVKFNSDQVARDVVLSGKNYIDWFPYDRTEKLAQAFFRGGRPFTNLANIDKQETERMLAIRNVIAHESSHARRVFQRRVIQPALPLPPRERTPAGFLRGQLRIAPIQTRFEIYMTKIVDLARKISP